MTALRLVGLGKQHAGRVVLQPIELAVAPGELVALVGPSGSGKSTALRIIAGLDEPSIGRVVIGGRDVTSAPPPSRDVAIVFQSSTLYSHLTVFENMAFALRTRRLEPTARVHAVASALGIVGLLDRWPRQLSSGERQQVAIGRALAGSPRVLLFDEPLPNLDPGLRAVMRREIRRVHDEDGASSLYATHDQLEATALADRIVVLRDGVVQQIGTAGELYDRPANRFVAGFFGVPSMNFLSAELAARVIPAARVPEVVIGIRPEALLLEQRPGAIAVPASVASRERLGAEVLLHVASSQGRLTVRTDARSPARIGDHLTVWLDEHATHVFDARSELRVA
jgi:ABC-type sugar transport system ATPase subunit